ncbi:MAG: hypothetical protein IPG00_13645 [Saprospiraceae bacterium]|nr:hypothetical protein [Saprospiraceae bacterium]
MDIKRFQKGTQHKKWAIKGYQNAECQWLSNEYQHEFRKILAENKGKALNFTYVSGQDTITKPITISDKGTIGIELESLTISTQKYGIFESLPKGWSMATNFLGGQLKAFGQIFTG